MNIMVRSRNTITAVVLSTAMLFIVASHPVWIDTWVILGVYSLLAISAGVGYGQAGILSMSQGAFAAIGGYTVAFYGQHSGLPPFGDLLLALALPACRPPTGKEAKNGAEHFRERARRRKTGRASRDARE